MHTVHVHVHVHAYTLSRCMCTTQAAQLPEPNITMSKERQEKASCVYRPEYTCTVEYTIHMSCIWAIDQPAPYLSVFKLF